MKKVNLLLMRAIVFLFILTSCNSGEIEIDQNNLSKRGVKNSLNKGEVAMLHNDLITKKSWVFYDHDEKNVRYIYSDLSEGHLDGNIGNYWDGEYITKSGGIVKSKDLSANTLKLVTLGYNFDKYAKSYPGFDFWILNNDRGNTETPLEFRIINNCKFLGNGDPEELKKLREVGFVFENWPSDISRHAFKDNYNINEFKSIKLDFKFKLDDYKHPDLVRPSLAKELWLGGYVTADFRVNFYENNERKVTYLIGVVFSNPSNVDFNNNILDKILFEEYVPEEKLYRYLIHANKIGVTTVNDYYPKGPLRDNNQYREVEIDFKPLLQEFIPNDMRNKKSIISGLDIYSASRGTDISYDIKEISLKGTRMN